MMWAKLAPPPIFLKFYNKEGIIVLLFYPFKNSGIT